MEEKLCQMLRDALEELGRVKNERDNYKTLYECVRDRANRIEAELKKLKGEKENE